MNTVQDHELTIEEWGVMLANCSDEGFNQVQAEDIVRRIIAASKLEYTVVSLMPNGSRKVVASGIDISVSGAAAEEAMNAYSAMATEVFTDYGTPLQKCQWYKRKGDEEPWDSDCTKPKPPQKEPETLYRVEGRDGYRGAVRWSYAIAKHEADTVKGRVVTFIEQIESPTK